MALFTKRIYSFLAIIAFILIGSNVFAVAKSYTGASGNWSVGANWNPTGVPGSGDDVTIPNNKTVTLNGNYTVNSLTIAGGNALSALNFNAGQILTVTGAVIINAGTGSGDNKTIAIGTGSLICGSIDINDSGGAWESRITVSTGTLQVNGSATLDGTTTRSNINFSGAGTLRIRGNITGAGNLTLTTANVELNGTTAQTVPFSTTGFNDIYGSLTLNNTAGASVSSASTISGALTLTAGTLNVASGITLNVGGNATRTSGLLTSSLTGTVNYNRGTAGQVVVDGSYGNLTFSNVNKVLPTATINIAGTFTPGSATGHTITGNTINFNGANGQGIPAFNYNSLASTNFTRTLSGVVGVANTFTPGTGVYTTTGSTVNFNGAGNQSIPVLTGSNYNNISTSVGGIKTVGGNLTVGGSVNVGASSTLALGGTTLTLTGAPSPLVVAATGTFTYGTSTVIFNSSAAQDVPANIQYYILNLTGTGNKNITAPSASAFTINRNLEISCPVTYNNVSSIFIFKEFNGTHSINSGSINITCGDDWFNTATNYSLDGTVTYSGLDGVTVTIGRINYKNLTITAGRGAAFPVTSVINGAFSISGILTVDQYATFTTNNYVTLISSASGVSNVAPVLGTISGNFNVQTYFTGGSGNRGTRMVSPSINDAGLAAGSKYFQQLKTNMVITGPGGVANGFDEGNSIQPFAVTLTKYNEPAPLSSAQFTPISNLNDGTVPAGTPGEGFFLFFRGNRTGYSSGATSPVLWSDYIPESFSSVVTGPLNIGNVGVAISNAGTLGDTNNGYNVVGNPYAATIDWESVYSANSANVANEIRIIRQGGAVMSRKDVGGGPVIVNAGDGLGSQYIQPGQAFYIRKTNVGNGTLNFTESNKAVTQTPDRLLFTPNQNSLQMRSNDRTMQGSNSAMQLYFNLTDNLNRDEAAIVFMDGFDANFDENDAPYLSGSTVILSSFSADGKANAINYMPALSNVPEMRINVNAVTSGPLTLTFTTIEALVGFKATLKDNYLNTLTDLKANPAYHFSIDKTIPSSFGANRFVLLFEKIEPLQINLEAFTLTKQNTSVSLAWVTANEQNSAKIEIERSSDGATFVKIGEK
ncbi:MAG: hypothetical protein EOO89_05930, partial [Pedobacter sp.]